MHGHLALGLWAPSFHHGQRTDRANPLRRSSMWTTALPHISHIYPVANAIPAGRRASWLVSRDGVLVGWRGGCLGSAAEAPN